MVFTASLFGAQHLGEAVKKKPESSLVVSLGKTLNGMPLPLRGRQVASFPPNKGLVAGRASDRKTNTMF